MLKINSKKFVGLLVAFAFVAASVANAAWAPTTATKITKSSPKADVMWLQQTLNATAGTTLTEDGIYGKKTTAAIKAFQKANPASGIADGIAGKKTVAALNAAGANLGGGTGGDKGGDKPVVTGPVSVALASDTPASGSFIAPASGVVFAKYTFTGTGTVNALKFMRTGISSSTTLSNVYLYDGDIRLTDASTVSSDNSVTFSSLSGLFTVAGTKTISIVADTSSADYSLGFTLTSVTSGTTVTPVSVKGNEMFGASATLATVAMTAATGSGDTDAGNDLVVWQGTGTVSTRDVILKRLALRNVGSISTGDIKNFRLYVDGVMAGTAVASLDSNGYVTFTPSVALKTTAHTLKVLADVVGGSSRTVQMSLRGAYDLITTDTQYNSNGVTTGSFPFGPASFSVNTGNLTVVKTTDSPSTNVTVGASDQLLGKYTFTAFGEPVKVETLRVGMLGTTSGTITNATLRNVRILVNGSQVGSSTSVPFAASFAADSGTSFTTNFVVTPGTPATVEVRGDLVDNEDNDDISAGTLTAVQATIVAYSASNNAYRQVSLGGFTVPSSNKNANSLTVASGSISVAKTSNYANQTVAVPQTAYKIGSYQLAGNSTEPVNLNTIYVGFTAGSTVTEATDLSDLYVVYGGTTSSVKGTVSSTVLNGNSWSINKTLAVNETITVDVYASLASSVSTNDIITTLAVAGTTANSGLAVYADGTANSSLDAGLTGQTITGGTGSITATVAASTPVAQLVDDTGTITSATFKLSALTDSYTVTDMTFTLGDASAVSEVTLKDHDTQTVIGAAKAGATTVTWSGLTYAVAAGSPKYVDVVLTLSPVGVGAGTTDASLLTTLTSFTAKNSGGTSAAGTESNPAGNAMYIYKAVPTVSMVSLPNSTLAAGTNKTIAKFTVATNGTGTIAWKQIMLEIAKTATPTISSIALYNADTGLQVTAATAFQNGSSGVATTCVADNTSCELLITVGTNADDDTVETVSGAKTYEVRATIGGSIAATDNVSVTMDRNTSSHAASAAEQTNDNATTANSVSFVWSDESASATNDTGVSTWQKDYLIKNLPISWTLD